MTVKIRGVRGVASYTTGGDNYTLGDVEKIAVSSGRAVAAFAASSSRVVPQVVNASGNIVTVMMRDLGSGGQEAASTTNFSTQHLAVVYEGV